MRHLNEVINLEVVIMWLIIERMDVYNIPEKEREYREKSREGKEWIGKRASDW